MGSGGAKVVGHHHHRHHRHHRHRHHRHHHRHHRHHRHRHHHRHYYFVVIIIVIIILIVVSCSRFGRSSREGAGLNASGLSQGVSFAISIAAFIVAAKIKFVVS